MEKGYNPRSPAVKRLMREAAELSTPTSDYFAAPLEENLFEWHFTVRGPSGTDYQDGIYHGRIIVPTEYPMKPPDIILLTHNGRFSVGQKICLSISGYHPETWQPSWSIRTALLAIIGFMPTPGQGTIGSLDYTPQERKRLAKKSATFHCDTCGTTPAQLLLPPPEEHDTSQKEEVNEIVASLQIKGSAEDSKTGNQSKADSESNQSTTDGSAINQSATDTNQSATDGSAINRSATDGSATSKSATDGSATNQSETDCSATNQSAPASSETTKPSAEASGTSQSARPSVSSSTPAASTPAARATQRAAPAPVIQDVEPVGGFQVSDVWILVVVVLIGLLLYRRFFHQDLSSPEVEEGTEDFSDHAS